MTVWAVSIIMATFIEEFEVFTIDLRPQAFVILVLITMEYLALIKLFMFKVAMMSFK